MGIYAIIQRKYLENFGGIMFDNIENLKVTSAISGESRNKRRIENRPSHSFIFRVHGSIIYDFGYRCYPVKEGEMIFLPKGSSYDYTTKAQEKSEYMIINFEGDFESADPAVYPLENFHNADYIISHFVDLWKLGSQADRYECISLFYSLLSYVSFLENSNSENSKKYSLIEPAVEYLKDHIYDCSLKSSLLHRLCGISDTYFRKIFVSRFRTTVQKYIISKRISHAKSLIDNGDFDSISEVAMSVGYSDPLYFSKVFKKFYGVSPSSINR